MFSASNSISIAYCQVESVNKSEAEQYRDIVQAMARKDYAEAMAQGYKLIERTNKYEQVYLRIVRAAKNANQLDRAKERFESLLQKSPPNHRGYFGLGLICNEQEDYVAAIEYYRKSLQKDLNFPLPMLALVDAFRKSEGLEKAAEYIKSLTSLNLNESIIHLGLGYCYAKNSQAEMATKEFDLAMSLTPKMPEACYHKALALTLVGQQRSSFDVICKCLPAVREEMNEDHWQAFLNLMAVNQTYLRNYSEASDLLNQALELARKIGDKGYEDTTIAYLGFVSEQQDNYSQALLLYQQGIAIAQENDNAFNIVNRRRYPGWIGRVYYAMGDLPTALHHFQLGLKMAEEAKDEDLQTLLFSYIGNIFIAQNNLPQAIKYFYEVARVNEKSSNPFLRFRALDVLSTLYLKNEKYQQAKDSITQALSLAQAMHDFDRELSALNNLGELHLRMNQPKQAIETFLNALDLALSKNSPRQAWVACSGLATSYYRLGQVDQARGCYLQTIKIMEDVRAQLVADEEKVGFFQDKVKIYKDLVSTLIELHGKEMEKGFDVEAFDYAERARGRGFLDLLAEAKVNLEQNLEPALLEKRQNIENNISRINAETVAERSKEAGKQNKEKIKQLEMALSDANKSLDDWVRDVRLNDPAYAKVKFPQPISLKQTQQLLDDRTVMLAYSLSEPSSLLFVVTNKTYRVFKLDSSSNIRASVDELRKAITGENGSSPSSLKYRQQAAKLYQSLIEPAKELLVGKKELVIVADESLHRLPFEMLLTTTPQGKWEELPYLIRDYTISYAPSASVLASLKEQTRRNTSKDFVAFADPLYRRDQQQSDQAKLLASVSTQRGLSVQLSRFNFLKKLFGSASLSTGRGNTGEQLRLDPLPHSRREATTIAELFPAGKADLFLGQDATEENAKAKNLISQYGIVHFSAHGFPNEDRPRFSSIVLSSPVNNKPSSPTTTSASATEDGWLSAYEIFNLKLNADLVVLSACETGLGKEVKGDGLMSLTRAFMHAGAPSVVVSLWSVDDKSTADLLIAFYRHLRQPPNGEKISYAEALRQAQLDSIRKGNSPYHWAPFVLLGRP